MDIKDKIRLIRESKGFTQEDIADKLGVTRANYRYFENRGNKLTIEQLENISNALGVSVGEILGLTLPKNDSLEVEQLRKRNEELEDRLNDKTKLLNNIVKSTAVNNFKVVANLASIILSFASDNNLLKVRYYKEKYGKIEEEIDTHLEISNFYERYKDYNYKTYFIDEKDFSELKSLFFNSFESIYFSIIYSIFASDDEDKDTYYDELYKKCLNWINNEFWHDYNYPANLGTIKFL